jgi:hypothetical protein
MAKRARTKRKIVFPFPLFPLELASSHPEAPSPLAGEGRGEGVGKTEHFEILNHYHRHPSLPRRGEREKWSSRMETRYFVMKYVKFNRVLS